jgi:hypothetical protein
MKRVKYSIGEGQWNTENNPIDRSLNLNLLFGVESIGEQIDTVKKKNRQKAKNRQPGLYQPG